MAIEGGCYCGDLRYQCTGDILFRGQCHCRECQYISGGGPNLAIGMPEAQFSFTRGTPRQHRRSGLDKPVTRLFCENCGTHIGTLSPGAPGVVIVKAGTLDDPALFGKAERAIWTCEKQDFHYIPEGIPTFEQFAPR